ncbi:hypothetical protein [Caloramator sp. E03]|nr:hypothetical protein [Caloramator sp. E03]
MDKETLIENVEKCYKNIFSLRNMLLYTQCPLKRQQLENRILYAGL